jgi:hypothetical protein
MLRKTMRDAHVSLKDAILVEDTRSHLKNYRRSASAPCGSPAICHANRTRTACPRVCPAPAGRTMSIDAFVR